MPGKRKRARPTHGGEQKRQRISSVLKLKEPVVRQALLAQYYPQVCSLREYLVWKLPASSKVRRKKILSVGRKQDASEKDRKLSDFLDQTLIGVSKCEGLSQEERWRQWTTFSQKPDDSASFADMSGGGFYSQSEVCFRLFGAGMVLSAQRDLTRFTDSRFRHMVTFLEEASVKWMDSAFALPRISQRCQPEPYESR